MNILLLNWKDTKNPDVGGAEILLYELAKRLVGDGHRVTWFCREFHDCKKQENIHGIDVIRRGNKLTVYWEAYRYYKSLRNKPDRVIESVNTLCWQTPIYVPHDKRIALVNQLAKEVFFYELPFPMSYAAYWCEKWEYQTYKKTRFICYSESVKDDIQTFGIPKDNIGVFTLGTDHVRYKPGKKSKEPLFVFVARLAKMKRPDLCIKAMKAVVVKYPKSKLAVIGYGPEEQSLQRLIKTLSLDENVFIINKDNLYFEKHHKDVKVKLMQEAWALLLPSVKEGWGMVVTESAACATPAIVSNVTGLRDSVKHGQTGIVLSSRPTSEEVAHALCAIIENQKMRNKLSREAVKFSQTFTWERSLQEFKEVIGIL